MAPEQLEGVEADSRADLWALGCVLHEMATGKRAFEGKSQASLITAIMGSEPAPVSQMSPLAPVALDRLVGACLAKDPADRIQSAHDVKLQLQWIAGGGSQTSAAAPVVPTAPAKRPPVGGIAFVAIAAALILGATAGYLGRGRSATTSASVADVNYKPITFEEGAALGIPYATAFRALFQKACALPGEKWYAAFAAARIDSSRIFLECESPTKFVRRRTPVSLKQSVARFDLDVLLQTLMQVGHPYRFPTK
jgi:hypothetical protein